MNDRIEQTALGLTRPDRRRLATDLMQVFRLKGWQPLPLEVEDGPDLATWAQTALADTVIVGGSRTTGRKPRFVGGANV